MPTVRIPSSLRSYSSNRHEIQASGASLQLLLGDLERQCPGILTRILDDKGQLRRFLNIYVGEEDVRFLQALQTPIAEHDTVVILLAAAGG